MECKREKNSMKISVVIPAHNREKYISKCLDSIINQSYKPYEIIVVDDASTDNTVQMVEKYASSIVRVIRCESNGGAQKARNIGIREAQGDWIAFLDSDDEWLPDKLEKQKKKIEETGYKVCAGGALVRKKEESYTWFCDGKSGNIYVEILQLKTYIFFQALLVQKQCLIDIGYLDEAVVAQQELDTAISLTKRHAVAFVDEPVFIYDCSHGDETISSNSLQGIQGRKYVLKKYREDIVKIGGYRALAAWSKALAGDYGKRSFYFYYYALRYVMYYAFYIVTKR